MCSITENIYYSQLSSVAILLQPETNCFTSYNTRKWLCFLPLCATVFRSPPAFHVFSSNGQWSSQLFCVYYKLSFRALILSENKMNLMKLSRVKGWAKQVYPSPSTHFGLLGVSALSDCRILLPKSGDAPHCWKMMLACPSRCEKELIFYHV
jgi:hypothetical protein